MYRQLTSLNSNINQDDIWNTFKIRIVEQNVSLTMHYRKINKRNFKNLLSTNNFIYLKRNRTN